MTVRLSQLLRGRTRPARDTSCPACGEETVADGHAIQLTGGVYHAGCVLYRPRPQAEGAPPRLPATR